MLGRMHVRNILFTVSSSMQAVHKTLDIIILMSRYFLFLREGAGNLEKLWWTSRFLQFFLFVYRHVIIDNCFL